ncbi:unnamed protein product [Urochloa decumbens]|uniref:Uncharacterized protein n=1 Tax=Urochloa decumbens TaxID=240449 RepID=A0ABC8ZGC8_9POAL
MPENLPSRSGVAEGHPLLDACLPGNGSFSCFHGGEDLRPPINKATLYDDITICENMARFYIEVERRLPLKEIPDLAGCIRSGGHCFGLADPVSNIILNAIGLLLHEQGENPRPPPPTPLHLPNRTRGTCGRMEMAASSGIGFSAFMTGYFRYLSSMQARRFLSLASYDLPLAIKLVHHDRFPASSQPRRLLPDGGKIEGALRVAAIKARHPAPDVLARLMTAEYPPDLLRPILAKLRGAEVLGTHDVWEIMDLLGRQLSPCAPQANMEFWCRPDGTGNCIRDDDGTLHLSTCIAEGRVARVSIPPTRNHGQLHGSYISDLTLSAAELNPKLSMCMEAVMKAKPRLMERLMEQNLGMEYDSSPCEHMLSLKLRLLDTIHAFYIKALAILAPSPSLLRALLVAGHCYGPMDPVSNIIVNSIWYHVTFPLARDTEVQLPEGILDTKLMARVESRSLNGLAAVLSPCQHNALEFLNHFNCSTPLRFCGTGLYLRAAKYAKHPQYDALGSFVSMLPTEEFDLDSLAHRLRSPGADLAKLFAPQIKSASTQMEAPCSLLPHASAEMSRKKSAFTQHLKFVRGELNKLLRKYCYQHPWEPNFKLELICGVRESKLSYSPNFYHVNFLAGTDDVEAKGECTLFFAEFWDYEAAKPSICCPVNDCFHNAGRCSFCENEGSKIVHPPSGGHYGDFCGSTDLLHCPNLRAFDFEDLLEEDYIYFDPDRDVELAEIINDFHRQKAVSRFPAPPPNAQLYPWEK